jgi:hypothetical protein
MKGDENQGAASNVMQRDLKTGQFLQGVSGNPAGRPKGSRNALGEAFLEALQQDFLKGGASAIEACRIQSPHIYVKIIAGILPREMSVGADTSDAFIAILKRINQDSYLAQPTPETDKVITYIKDIDH